ncbi:MAG: tetratricopeptide repeat protein [candidate division WOR-3 bacterium]
MKMCPILSVVAFEEKEGKKIPKIYEVSCVLEKCSFWNKDVCTFMDKTSLNLISTKIVSSIEKNIQDLRGEFLLLKEETQKYDREYFSKVNEILLKFEKALEEIKNIGEEFKNRTSYYEKLFQEIRLSTIYEKIFFLLSRGEYDLAYEEINKIEEDKKDVPFKILEGVILFKKGEREKAKEIFENLIEKGITAKEVYNNLGLIYYEEGKYEKAIEIFERGLKFSRDFPEILYHLGLAYYKSGEIEKAFEMWEEVIEIDPEFLEAKEALEKYKEGK